MTSSVQWGVIRSKLGIMGGIMYVITEKSSVVCPLPRILERPSFPDDTTTGAVVFIGLNCPGGFPRSEGNFS